MKVIKEGKEISRTMKVTCKTCKAVLEIDARDLKEDEKDWPSLPSTYSYKCPCCNERNYLGYTDLSDGIRNDLH